MDNIENVVLRLVDIRKNLGWVKNVRILNNRCKNNGKDNAILTLAKCKNITLKQNTFQNTSGMLQWYMRNFRKVYKEYSISK